MSNPFLERIAKAGTSAHGGRSERRLAKQTGAKLHPASGALAGAKSDATLAEFRVENKATIKDSINLERHWLEKISHEAQSNAQVPMLTISFVNGDGSPKMHTNADWVAIPLWKLQELLDR